MFRDCKTGGYNLEGSGLREDRLIKMILLMAIVYTSAIFQGTEIQKKQVQKYVSRRSQARKKYRRRSTFGVGKDGEQWVDYLDRHSLEPTFRRYLDKFNSFKLGGIKPWNQYIATVSSIAKSI